MNRERRNGKPPIPDDVRSILTTPQKDALTELEAFGWVIDYVRRPLFQDPKVVVHDPDSGKQAMIHEDGLVDYSAAGLVKREND